MNINWSLISSDVTAFLTMLAMIPYDKDTMEIVNHVVPETWIPWVIKLGLVATLGLRLFGRYLHQEAKTEIK